MIQRSGEFFAEIITIIDRGGYLVRFIDSATETPYGICQLLGEENRDDVFFFAPHRKNRSYKIGDKLKFKAKIISYLEELR